MARNQFIDPAGNRATYSWEVNHSEEQENGKRRNIEHGANTGNTGFVRQQSDAEPLKLQFSGTIFHKAQVAEMIAWWDLCDTQTIHFVDYAGDKYEVTIVSFVPTRHWTLRNPRDHSNAPTWYWKYEIEMDVIRVLEGVWAGVST